MKVNSPILFIKFNIKEIFIFVGKENDNGSIDLLEMVTLPTENFYENRSFNFLKIGDLVKKNILYIEKKLNCRFRESIIILDSFDITYLNLSGFKKLNGTQILKENITYLLNSLKAIIDKTENKKNIVHIFNSKYSLDKKEIENLPIGLFGDFYSQELSLSLIHENDYKNLKKIFDNCDLKITKILLENFVKVSTIKNSYPSINTFLYIEIENDNSKIFYVENDSLKYEQKFNFGLEIILKDISKITSLKVEMIKKFIEQNSTSQMISEKDLVERKYFDDQVYRKIKKKLIFEIAEARIKELSEIICFNNINFKKIASNKKIVFLEISNEKHLKCFEKIYKSSFNPSKKYEVKLVKKPDILEVLESSNNIVQYGWKSEAIPFLNSRKSLISRILGALFH